MSIEILATQALALLTPYLAKGAEEISKSVAKDLWGKTKSIFKSKKKEELLEKFSSSPEDAKMQGQVEYILQEELAAKSELLAEFRNLVDNLKATTEFKSEITQTGDNNIAVGGQINNSSININK